MESLQYPTFNPQLITDFIKKENQISDTFVQELIKSPGTFFNDIKNNKITINSLLSILSSNPEIKTLSHKGLSFYHYLALNDDYDFVFNAFLKCLEQGVTTIPLTESIMSSSKYKPNQPFFEFIFEQDCLNSYKAFFPYIQKTSNEILSHVFLSSYHSKKKWFKFFSTVYDKKDIEKSIYVYYKKNPEHFSSFCQKFTSTTTVLSVSNLLSSGVNLFENLGNGSLLSTLITNQNFVRYIVNEQYNSTSFNTVITTPHTTHYNNATLFFETIITDPQYNSNEAIPSLNMSVGELILKHMEQNFPLQENLINYQQKLLIQNSITISDKRTSKLKF